MTAMRPSHAWFGALAAVYLLAGRWNVGRLSGADADGTPFFLEIRFWAVLLLATGLVLPPAGSEADVARQHRNRPVLVLMLVLFAYLLATALWAPEGAPSLEKAFDVALVAVATFSLVRIFASDGGPRIAVAFWISILALAAVLAVIGAWTAATGRAEERLAVLGGGPNVFGRMMGYLAVAALFCWRRYGKAAVFLPLVSVAGVLIVLTGSRGGMLSLAVALCAFAVVEMRSVTRVAVGVAAAAAIAWMAIRPTSMGRAVAESYQERVQALLLQEQYTSGRDVLYRNAYHLGLSHPAFGAGLAAFPGLGLGVYPHNIFLELFSETGLFGLALFCAVLALAARGRRQVDGAALTGFVLILVASQFSGDFYDSRGVFAFLAAALWLPPSRPGDG